VNNLVWNLSSIRASQPPSVPTLPPPLVPTLPPPFVPTLPTLVSSGSPQPDDEHLPPLISMRTDGGSPQTGEHPQHVSKSPTVSASSNPKLTTAFVQAQSLDNSITSFIGPLKGSVPDGDSPSHRLQRGCPICFPAHRPRAFDR
jgi:hypothetical protein